MSHHFLGTNGITGGGIPIGTGAGLALKRRDTGQISVVFLGDGASNQGTFHESLNMASLWGLPVLYVCENNGYAMSQPLVESSAIPRIAEKASAYRMPGEAVDGMDIRTVRETARAAVEYVRSGNGPMLLELLTYRFCGHSKNDARAYRTREEEGEWAERDCLRIAEEALGEVGVSAAAIEATRDAAARHIDDVVSRALRCSPGDHDHAVGGVYA